MHLCAWETEAGGSLSCQGQPGLLSKTPSQKNKIQRPQQNKVGEGKEIEF